MTTAGYIYVLSNESMPELVKIGRTNRTVEQRIRELQSTGVPTPFKVEFSAYTDNSALSEATIHRALEAQGVRTSANREFFKMSVVEATAFVRLLVGLNEERELDYPTWTELRQLHVGIKIPDSSAEIQAERAFELEEQLVKLGRAGYANSFKALIQVFGRNFISASRSREYWRLYLEGRLREIKLFFDEPNKTFCAWKGEFGMEVAEYLIKADLGNWLMNVDFEFASEILQRGDRFTYEGYINFVNRHGFPEHLRLRAQAV